MTSAVRHIDLCLARLGTAGFAQAFCDFVETLGIDQIMVFSISEGQTSCLMSRHFSRASLAEELAAMYLDGWYKKDPLLPELLASKANTVTLRRLDDVSGEMSADYRRLFFDAPGLHSKTTLLGVGTELRLFVSFYQNGSSAPAPDPELSQLAGRLALLHFERQVKIGYPALLDVLSTRERAVCLGILAGQKAELIAADIGVAFSTVVTYRKRAYSKLGISSRASLFAICRTQHSPEDEAQKQKSKSHLRSKATLTAER